MTATNARKLRHAEAAIWGPRPIAAERPRMRLISWKTLVKGSLRGFATIELPSGLKIHDCPVLVSSGNAWATLPSKPQIDGDGRQKTDINGKAVYASILEWRSRELSDRFSQAVVSLVIEAHPGALDETGR
jgi:hypothetical protein